MAKIKIVDQVMSTDVLVIGGGLAGCMAAIKAREQGAGVVLMEKCAIRRSGDAGRGLDHLPNIAHPEINGITPEELVRRREIGLEGLVNTKLSLVTPRYALHVVRELERIGVKVKEEDGTYKLQSGRLKGVYDFILFRGADLKIKLTAEVHRCGTKVLERTMLTNLLTVDGTVVGAMGLNIRSGKLVAVAAKATIIATGGVHRLYWHPHGEFPSNLFLTYEDPQKSGDGTIAAYRAGAKLVNMEFLYTSMDALLPRAFTMTWYDLKDAQGENILERYVELAKKHPTDPPYARTVAALDAKDEFITWDPTTLPEEARRFWDFMMSNERPYSLRMAQMAGGLRNAPREARMWVLGIPRSLGGIVIDEHGRATLAGLYAAGDVSGGAMMSGGTGALAWGYVEGRDAALYAQQAPEPVLDEGQLEIEGQLVLAPLRREEGIHPLTLENAVRKIIADYVGFQKHEKKLKHCLDLLGRVQIQHVPRLMARTPHELMRALEVQNIIDLGKIHARAALIREESRMVPWHYRLDYPNKDDDKWQKAIIVWQQNGEMAHYVGAPWN